MEGKLLLYREDLLRQIKSQKFPMSNAVVKLDNGLYKTVTKNPDYTGRLVGAQELAIAVHTPLKHITAQMLNNYWLAGRLDLVSALIERAALNYREFKIDQWNEIKDFALRYYAALNIQSLRQILRYLNSFLSVVAFNKTIIAQFQTVSTLEGALKIKMMQDDFTKSLNDDDLLEE